MFTRLIKIASGGNHNLAFFVALARHTLDFYLFLELKASQLASGLTHWMFTAKPVTESEFKMFQQAMKEQGQTHSSTADVRNF